MDKIGRYEVEKVIGVGGMGVVYKAWDPTLSRDVAIKLIKKEALDGKDADHWLQRFRIEAHANARLDGHSGFVRLYDFDVHEGSPYMVMEFVDGGDLAALSRRGLEPSRALAIVRQAADALDFAHAEQIFHRDIKLENVMLMGADRVRIADFGTAKVVGVPSITPGGMMLGSFRYLPPESLGPDSKTSLDRRDQYALGVVAFHLLIQDFPFDAPSVSALYAAILYSGVPHDKLRAKGFEDEVCQVFERVLNKDPSKRFENCAAFASALRDAWNQQRNRAAEAEWLPVRHSWDVEVLRAFASKFPDARITGECWDQIRVVEQAGSEWEKISGAKDMAAMRAFLVRFPGYPDAVALLGRLEAEEKAWKALGDTPSEEQLDDFLARFDHGQYAGRAQALLRELREDRADWEAAKSALRGYLERRPTGRYVHRAKAALIAFEAVPGRKVEVNPIDGLRYVWIPHGRFLMGSPDSDPEAYANEKPAHWVRITKGFWLSETPVTQAAWRRVMKSDPSHFKGDDRPVEGVSWKMADQYARKAGGWLPTEAKWEYAARAGSTASRYGKLEEIAWTGSETGPVRSKAPNDFGLYDMIGNVWEWVADSYGPYNLEEQENPTGPRSDDMRVLRGGSYRSDASDLRCVVRSRLDPAVGDDDIGFRVARE